jgi:hypothetical protein
VVVAGCGSGGAKQPDFGARLSAKEIVGLLFANHCIPVGEDFNYSAANDPNSLLGRPGGYTSKVNFTDDRLGAPPPRPAGPDDIDVSDGGSVEVFGSASDADKRAKYVRSLTRGNPLLGEYSYVRGRVFLRVSKDLTPAQADKYRRALSRLLRRDRCKSPKYGD